MNFDDLFTLLLFIVFIGLPLLNRMQQRGRGGAPPGAPPGRTQRPGTPGQPPGTPGQRSAAPGQPPQTGSAPPPPAAGRQGEAPSQASGPAERDDPFAELAKRLEEARRRVREAAEGPDSGSATVTTEPRRTVATPAPASAPLPDPRAGAAPRPRAARDPFPKGRAKPEAPWGSRPAPRTKLREEAPALEVQRGRALMGSERRSREEARLRANDLVALDAQSFRKGIMWHMVLSGPVAHRNRRMPSPPASR